MKLLFDLTSLADNASGIERFASNIALYYIAKHNENSYILLFKDHIDERFREYITDNSKKIVVIKRYNKLFFSQFILPFILLFYKADYYLFLAFPAPFMFFNKRSISAIHDLGCWDCPQTMKKMAVFYYRLLYCKAAFGKKKIITVSNFSKERISTILHKRMSEIYVVYNGVSDKFTYKEYSMQEIDELRNRYNLPEKFIFTLSTIEPRKNLALLVNAYTKLEDTKGYALVIGGRKGWLVDELLNSIQNDNKHKIVLTGFIEDDDLPKILGLASVFVFPSLYEGFGIPPLEALSCGCKVISSDAASLPEVLGDNATYFKNNDEADLVKTLKYWMIEKNDEIKKYDVSKYTWENSCKMFERIF